MPTGRHNRYVTTQHFPLQDFSLDHSSRSIMSPTLQIHYIFCRRWISGSCPIRLDLSCDPVDSCFPLSSAITSPLSSVSCPADLPSPAQAIKSGFLHNVMVFSGRLTVATNGGYCVILLFCCYPRCIPLPSGPLLHPICACLCFRLHI